MGNPIPLNQTRLAAMFPGFDVSPQDFAEVDGAVFRVNSDGSRHSLEKWSFDEPTGEFYRITGRDHESVFFETMTYSERKVDLRKGLESGEDRGHAFAAAQKVLVAVLTLGIVGAILIVIGFIGAFGEGRRGNPFLPNLIGMFVGAVLLYLAYKVMKKKAPDLLNKNIIGPQPLKRLPLKAPVHQQPAGKPMTKAADYSGKMS